MTEIAAGQEPLPARRNVWALGFACLVLALPLLLVLAGLYSYAAGGSVIWPLAAVLVAAVLYYGGRPERADPVPLESLPTLRVVLDRVCSRMDAPRVARLVIIPDFNAYMGRTAEGPELGIGALLWEAASPEERLALIGHELAHLVNNDPQRDKIIHRALDVLARWYEVVEPDWDAPLASLVFLPFALITEAAYLTLIRATFRASQRAEYVADVMAARVAGTGPALSLMRRLTLAALMDDHARGFASSSLPEGRAMLTKLAEAYESADKARVAALLEDAREQRHSIDNTHPATRFREDVLLALTETEAAVEVSADEWAAIDAEMIPHLDRMGSVWTSQLEAQ